jgi:hypothetical protein
MTPTPSHKIAGPRPFWDAILSPKKKDKKYIIKMVVTAPPPFNISVFSDFFKGF